MIDKRLKILSQSEINELYGIPQFNSNEQESYFDLTKKEYKVMSERGSLASKLHFVLQFGYFKATSQFFNCTFDEVKSDVGFILQKYFENTTLQVDKISKQTRHTNQTLISKILKFKTAKSIIQKRLKKMLVTKVRLSSNPVYLFHEVLCYCAEQKLMLLGYSSIQKLIGSILRTRQNFIPRHSFPLNLARQV